MTPSSKPAGHGGRCGAKKKQGTGQCGQTAGWGTDHAGTGRCKLHGGKTKNHNTAAQVEQAQAAATEFGLAREIEPQDALIEELHRTAGLVAFYGQRAAELQTQQLHGPVGGGLHAEAREEAHVWVRLHQEERVHFTRVAKVCIEVGIEERRVRIAEQQGELLATVIRGILGDLGHKLDDPEVRKVVRGHLQLVSSTAA